MKWTATQPVSDLLTLDEVLLHLRIDVQNQDNLVLSSMIDAATGHAEQVMQCSLITRTIYATFYSGEQLYLPRGPIQNITSVTINGVIVPPENYSTESYGHTTILRYNNGTIQPHPAPAVLMVTYQAGYSDSAMYVPAAILAAVRAHVALLYENREAAGPLTIKPIPFLEDFYRLHSLDLGIG